MSHVTTVDVVLADLSVLDLACQRLGLELVKDRREFRRFSGSAPCDHCIRIPGNDTAYQIGVVKRSGGPGYELQLDSWQGGYGMLDRVGGETCPKLRQAYAEVGVMRQMGPDFSWTRQELGEGRIRLVGHLRAEGWS